MDKFGFWVIAGMLFLFSTAAFSQKNEFGFSAGATFTSDQRTSAVFPCPPGCSNIFGGLFETNPGFTLEATYARQLIKVGPASVYLEVPVVGVLDRDVRGSFTFAGLAGTGTSPGFSASSVFFTPSAKVKFLEEAAPIAPFVTVGGGLAHSNVNFNALSGDVPGGARRAPIWRRS